MAQKIYNLKVFVGSPSDVNDERVILEKVINELNKLPGGKLGIRLELVKWETDTYPSIGDDAQSVINEQIGDDYDIFIGVLWHRFGTPTKKAESGTAEEFSRAYERAKEQSISIKSNGLLYMTPVSLNELEEVEQYGKVISFRKELGERGVYYWTYKETQEFTSLVRLHLARVMEEFGTKWGQKSDVEVEANELVKTEVVAESTSNQFIAAEIEAATEEEGFLDLIISSVENMELSSESLNRLSEMTTELNGKTEEGTVELTNLSQPVNPTEAKRIINRQADNWEDYAKRAEAELLIFTEKFHSSIDFYIKAGHIMNDFQTQDKNTVQSSYDAMVSLRVVLSMPKDLSRF